MKINLKLVLLSMAVLTGGLLKAATITVKNNRNQPITVHVSASKHGGFISQSRIQPKEQTTITVHKNNIVTIHAINQGAGPTKKSQSLIKQWQVKEEKDATTTIK